MRFIRLLFRIAAYRDVVRTTEHIGLNNFDLLGHSLGGKVAMVLATHHPSLLRRLIVSDIAPVQYANSGNKSWKDVQDVVCSIYASWFAAHLRSLLGPHASLFAGDGSSQLGSHNHPEPC